MANLVAPMGFAPRRYLNGAPYNGASNLYYIPSTDANQFNVGDAVVSAAGGDANGVPAVTKNTTGTGVVRGVIVGVQLAAQNTTSFQGQVIDLTAQNVPATKSRGYYVLVADDPNILFALEDDGLSALTAAACNKNASFTVTNPTAPRQNSATVLSTVSVATTQGLSLRIMGLDQQPNNTYGANANWLIKFNQHEMNGNVAGV